MTFRAHNNYAICKQVIADKAMTEENSFAYEKAQLPCYEICDISDNECFNVGDVVCINSKPTKLINGDDVKWLVNIDHIAGKVL